MVAQEIRASEQLQRREIAQAHLGAVDEHHVQARHPCLHPLEIRKAQPGAIMAGLQVLQVREPRTFDRHLPAFETGTLLPAPAL